jgi:hypothetical protein
MRQDEEDGGQDELSALRAEIREDYGTKPEAPEHAGRTRASLSGRLRRWWRNMRPVGRGLLIGVLVIAALAVVRGGSLAVASMLATPVPPATPTFTIVPIPISISLPGGQIYPLEPQPQPERGPQVCRLVPLPWTIQLEAALRNLKSSDEIKINMSNYDTLLYKFQSIEQVPTSDIDKLAKNNGPCLLVVLSKADTDINWVLTAKP